MYSFRELKKGAKLSVEGKEIKLAIMGNCATQMLATGIKGYAALEGLNLNVLDTDYNQIDAQLLDENSETFEFAPDNILMYISSEKIYEEFMELPAFAKQTFADDLMAKITGYWDRINSLCKCNILQFNFVEIDDRAYGNYSTKLDVSFIWQIRKLNYLLQENAAKYTNVYLVDLSSIQNRFGRNNTISNEIYYTAKITVALDMIPYVASNVVAVLAAMQGRGKKCVVLDLDNTLWGGVIGDDGIGNIEIGELGRGHAFTNFQLWLKQLKERGVLLAVCSKNDEANAKEPFEKHPEMVLKLDDISAFVANWEDKAQNIRNIREGLNLGMDSFVFIDDNPFERNLVRTMIPEITVPELPEDPAHYLDYIQSLNLFETISYSKEDAVRTSQYKSEFERQKLQNQFSSIDDYLKSLEMVGEAKPFDEMHFSRIAQLTQRSNQFNLRTVRYTETDIKDIAGSDDYITRYYTLKDKFGDHGLVSVLIMKKEDADTLFVDTWLMSCRVLKRGMEEFIINQMVAAAKDAGFKKIKGEYIQTPKNAMVRDIYEKMNFTKVADNQYELMVADFVEIDNYIELNQED